MFTLIIRRPDGTIEEVKGASNIFTKQSQIIRTSLSLMRKLNKARIKYKGLKDYEMDDKMKAKRHEIYEESLKVALEAMVIINSTRINLLSELNEPGLLEWLQEYHSDIADSAIAMLKQEQEFYANKYTQDKVAIHTPKESDNG